MTDCWIATGGNVGDVKQQIASALDWLNGCPGIEVRKVSSYYETPPMGASAGQPFLNGAAELRTETTAESLLDYLQEAETRSGRKRLIKWGPRTLDLDLILFGDDVITTPRLIVPHPHFWYRRFVLDPLAEIAPDVVHPTKQQKISELRARLLSRPLRCLVTGDVGRCEEIVRRVEPEFPQAAFEILSEHFEEITPSSVPLVLWIGTSGDHDVAGPSIENHTLAVVDLAQEEDQLQSVRDVIGAALGT